MRPILGLMPAAGRATRLGRLPCSKEILPVAFDAEAGPVPTCLPLLRGWADAGVERALVLLRRGKWDVAEYLGDGREHGAPHLAYLEVGETASVPETLDRARPWTDGHDVALGFPDLLLDPRDAWTRLVDFHRRNGADASLGCFPCDRPDKADMVELDEDGRLRRIVIKDPACDFEWTWSVAIWRPVVTELLHRVVREATAEDPDGKGPELWVGDVLRRAVEEGLDVRGLRFPDGSFRDVGTPEDLAAAVGESSG